MVMPRKEFSVLQRRKQLLSDWKVAGALLQALWSGMVLPDTAAAYVHVMNGYYRSMAEAVLRATASPHFPRRDMSSWRMLTQIITLLGPMPKNHQVAQGASRRTMHNHLKEMLFFLEGWSNPEVGSQDVPRPTYQ